MRAFLIQYWSNHNYQQEYYSDIRKAVERFLQIESTFYEDAIPTIETIYIHTEIPQE